MEPDPKEPVPNEAESRAWLHHLFEAAPDPIFVVDPGGRIVDANTQASRVFGYPIADMRGRTIEFLVPEARREGHVATREKYLCHPERRPMGLGLDLEARRQDGSTFPVDITLGPFDTAQGRYVTAIVRDVTDRRAAERELARKAEALEAAQAELNARNDLLTHANSELEAFAYSVSHDLRTPLRAMQGLGMALEEDFSDQLPAQAQDYLRRIVAAAKRMDTLILDLLAYSRIGRGQSVHLAVDLDPLWKAVHEELGPAHQACVRIRTPLGRVWGNPSMLAQIATNLVANAIKFVAPGCEPRVEVESRTAEGRVRVSVRDNGIGIDPAHQARIFGIFERLHGVEQYAGTGIGLALVKKAVEGMKGTVGVESTPGQGSCFWFELEQAEGS